MCIYCISGLTFLHITLYRFTSAPTNEARRWWVGLNLLLGVLLDDVPKLPYKFRMKNVEGLIWVPLTMLNIWCEQVVVWLLVPLREKINTIQS